ncbi:molybdate ABC transporter substrate-binding protein [Novosphingobium beihaiensis]|uniref:Molybdate ABC transporter substrate-binding protein n=1 Tax=Novosphingobium beihaiensis TaxID=2930389 RepID=A0ABT0BQD4_9SPHN|nr:molybdate ABC transporter substrate-binding protein [Novosphingobium beihaiensis]MCJ2187273.1 molybdate ABC transporter substrate-binding protein [Novosphingobium beihaiensis]
MRKALALFLTFAMMLAAPMAMAAGKPQAPLVLAAASLQESMNAAADAWAKKGHPRPRISFASSSALARQIEAGAPADLFVSANERWMDKLQSDHLLKPRTRVSFLRNTLVLIAPRGSKMKLPVRANMPLAKALGSNRLAIADPSGVPAGIYAKQALTKLGIWNSLRDKLAPAENVRATLALVSRGAAPLGIVYGTDAQADPSVKVIGLFPQTSHTPISYPVALLAASKNPEAEGFRRFLISSQGKAVFRRFGFGTK